MMSVQPRVRFVFALSIFSTVLLGSSFAQEDLSVAVAGRVVNNMMQAWRDHDGHAYAAEFWPDAEFVNIFGAVMKDQEEIATLHDRIMKGPLKERQPQMTIRRIRRLAPNVIIVDCTDTDASKATQGVTRMKLILEMRGDVWHIVAGQNTGVRSPPSG